MKLFQVMPCRIQGYQATLDGYLKTDKLLVSFNDICNNGSNILTPSGVSDHLGSYIFIPILSFFFNLDINISTNIFFIGYGILTFIISIYYFNKIKFNYFGKIYGFFCIFLLFLLNIFISDTYSFYGLTSLALIPVWYFFFKKNLINEKYSLILYSIFTGLLIAFSEMVRGQSGSIILLCILIYYFFSIEKQIKLKFISLIILIFPLILSQILLSHLSEKRNLFFKENPNFLYELEKRDIPLNHVRAVWHNAYYNLGFLSYYKSEFPKNTDEYSVKKAKKINPNVVPYTKEYEKILMKEYFNFVKDYPLYFIKITFAKLGVIIMYLIVFINIGIYNLFKKGLSNQVKFFFLPGIFLNSSLGLAAEPDYSYLLGMFAFASMMSVYTLEKNK